MIQEELLRTVYLEDIGMHIQEILSGAGKQSLSVRSNGKLVPVRTSFGSVRSY